MKLLVMVLVFAIVTYLAIRLIQDGGLGGTALPRKPSQPKPKPPRRPIAPDDDEAFLRDLDVKRRQQDRRADPPPDQS